MEAHVGVPNENVRKSRTILRVVAESRWSKELVQRVIGTPHELTPVDDGELNSDDIEASEQPHEAEGEGIAGEGGPDVPEAHPVPRRVRITAKDLKKHGYTPGCPRCADLESHVQEVRGGEEHQVCTNKRRDEKGRTRKSPSA